MEQGRPFTLGETDPQTRASLALLQHAVDAQVKDWDTFTRQATQFHLMNARAWASTATGQDLSAQIDPDFVMGPTRGSACSVERLQALLKNVERSAGGAL